MSKNYLERIKNIVLSNPEVMCSACGAKKLFTQNIDLKAGRSQNTDILRIWKCERCGKQNTARHVQGVSVEYTADEKETR